MTPKEKAIEILEKFNSWEIINDNPGSGGYLRELYREDAIDLAKDLVNELFKESAAYNSERMSFWQATMQELEKM